MNHRLRTTLTSAALAAVTLTATAACSTSGGTDTPAPDPVQVISSSPSPNATYDGPDGTDTADEPAEPEPLYPTASALPDGPAAELREIAFAPAPAGTGPQIALRFLQALQLGDDLAADRELFALGRNLLATHDLTFLGEVMDDVRTNAALATAGPCTRGDTLSRDSALITCGGQRIVVHVLADQYGSGVLIADWLRHYDHYRGKHTHAFTTKQL